MEKIFSMVGGDGEFSYEKMGVIQAYTIRKLEPLLGEAIKHLNLPEHGPLHIADFGCSTGKNSITCINFIVKSIAERYAKAAGETSGHDTTCMPEMLVFFIDLPVNDFNHLIQLLASKAKNGGDSIGVDGADVEKVNNYFSAAVGGSFYNRLLPKESMHFAISTWALHWMSQV
jgi:gibberellin A4 carboxyl methyltransferase